MAHKKETKTEKIEREYVIPLRQEWKKVPRYKRAAKAIKAIKEFLVRHMKIYDRDLKKIKINKYLNEFVWFRGIKKPPVKIKVKAIKKDDTVIAELAELPVKLKFKKLREEKKKKKAETGKKKKTPTETRKKEEETKEKEEKRLSQTQSASSESRDKEKTEKTKSGEDTTKKLEKQKARQLKHQVGGKTTKPKRQIRKALEK